MEFIGGAICILIMFDVICSIVGKDEFKKDSMIMQDPTSGQLFGGISSIGYGLMRIFPGLRKIRDEEVFAVFRSRYDDALEIEANNRSYTAHQISLLLVSPLIGLLLLVKAFETGDDTNIILSAGVMVFMTAGLFISGKSRIKKEEEERIDRIKDGLPDVINRMVILLHSGMSMSRVLCNIGEVDEDSPLYSELCRVREDIKNTGDAAFAMARMQRRCPCYEISRLYGIIELSENKGSDGVSERLSELSLELWETKRNSVKKKSATLSQKLMLPTILLFAVVLLLAAVPAFISFKEI